MVFILNATLILGSSEVTPLTLCRIKEGKIIISPSLTSGHSNCFEKGCADNASSFLQREYVKLYN
tara:strand:+ start:605 stop:799 length:195 start_codon:yes stop_codon:yes gene_type:complete